MVRRGVRNTLPVLPLLIGALISIAFWWFGEQRADATHGSVTSHWTCRGGGLGGSVGGDGDCFDHWSYADNTWHWLAEVPTGATRTAISAGHSVWEAGHALNNVYDSGSVSHVHYDTDCTVGCVANYVITDVSGTGNDHIESYQLHIDSSQSWNTNTSAAHGSFSGRDLMSTAAHEWGHGAGFGHSTSGLGHSSGVNNAVATMCPGCGPPGHSERRDLSSDDVAARCQVYRHAHNYAC